MKPCTSDWDDTSIGAFKILSAGGGLIAEVIGIDRGGGGQDPCYRVSLTIRVSLQMFCYTCK